MIPGDSSAKNVSWVRVADSMTQSMPTVRPTSPPLMMQAGTGHAGSRVAEHIRFQWDVDQFLRGKKFGHDNGDAFLFFPR